MKMKNFRVPYIITSIIALTLLSFFVISTDYLVKANTVDTETSSETPPTIEIAPTKILFIGNSSTYYNNMPKMVKGLAVADGKNVEVTSITASGYKLSQFTNSGNMYYEQIINALKTSTWDFVVLQDHREAIMQNIINTEKAVAMIKELATASGAQIVLYETQGDCNGRDFTINDTSIFFDNLTLQYYMTKNYFSVGNKYDSLVATAGVNYTRCMNLYPEINLYDSDMIHPSPYGSYLAACSLYETMFETSVFGNQFLPNSKYDSDGLLKNLETESLQKLQNVANATLKLTQNRVELLKGSSKKITATFNIASDNTSLEDYKNIPEYFSLNDDTVSVNRTNGTITAISTGDTMVMATTDSGLMTMYSVSVVQPSTSFTIAEPSTAYLHKKDTFTYTTTLFPEDSTDKITWISSAPDIVSVDENGVVIAKKIGVAKITATTDSGIKLTRNVRVKLATPTNVKVKKLSTKAKSKKYVNVKISWRKNKNAVCYYVYRSTKKGSGYKKIATTTTANYIDKNKKKGKTFYYKIRSVYSNTKCNSYRTTGAKIQIAK